MVNKLPKEIIDQSKGKFLGVYQSETNICGIKGEITYYSYNNVVNNIQWTVDSCNEKNKQKLIDFLKDRYGEPKKTKGMLSWVSDKNIDNTYVSLSENKNGKLIISWL